MTQIKIYIPNQQPELEQAIQALVQDTYDQTAEFTTVKPSPNLHKGAYTDLVWQVLTVIATIEGTLQFADRAKLMERIKELIALCKREQVEVVVEIDDENPFEITQQPVDDTVDRLSRPKK